MSLHNHYRPQDIEVFLRAAKFYDVYIVVRRTNPLAIRWIGLRGYAPKRLDCKAKTASADIVLQGRPLKIGGLVVDPTLRGFEAAYGAKHGKAVDIWRQSMLPLLAPPAHGRQGQGGLTYMPQGGLYAVQMDPADEHYGCLLFSSSSLYSAGVCIHGDYDLFDIVPRRAPQRNVFVEETRLGQAHARSPAFFDVQHYVNRHLGAAMVLHGEQVTYKDDPNDSVDVFCPDGRILSREGAAAINDLYRTEFQGRTAAAGSRPTLPAGGLWRQT